MKMIFAAAALSLVLYGPALAQGSNQGTPNTLHGSGDMMQDGPHASSVQGAETNVPPSERPSAKDRSKYCADQWKAAEANGTTNSQSREDFIAACLKNG